MPNVDIIAGLDIGSATIRMAVGEVVSETNRINIIGLSEGPSAGVNKGTVRSIEEVVEAIGAVVENAERMTGLTLDHAYIAISGSHIVSQKSKGVIAISRPDGEIREDDVNRVLEAAQAVSVPPNYEILHVLPRNFSIDNQTGIKDPIGMNGVRLEVEAQIIEGQSAHIKNVTKAVNLAGIGIDDLVLASLAGAESALTERQKDLGVALVNIGAATTSLLVFEEGDILHVSVLPVGSAHITNDIAIGLRTNIDVAETIKIHYGQAVPDHVGKNDEIEMRQVAETEDGVFSCRHLAEIIEARAEEIFHMVDKNLRDINRSGKLPAGIILTGAGAKLPGIVEVAKREFRLPASIGRPLGIESAIDRINDPGLTTAVGLVLWGQANQTFGGRSFGSLSLPGLGNISNKMKSFVRLFKP
ncbi:MAG: cell division protein FtsA [Candidatus Komeilibacteria bacterium]|nr:cell division protein FtsA [Candidatus Komeilibacteria bacterium]